MDMNDDNINEAELKRLVVTIQWMCTRIKPENTGSRNLAPSGPTSDSVDLTTLNII